MIEEMINLTYLFRTKKYGKWEKGKLEVSINVPKIEYKNLIIEFLKSEYLEYDRIEVQNINLID